MFLEDDKSFRNTLFKMFIRCFAYGRPEYQLVNMLDASSSNKEDSLNSLNKTNTASITKRRKINLWNDFMRVFVYFFGIQVMYFLKFINYQ